MSNGKKLNPIGTVPTCACDGEGWTEFCERVKRYDCTRDEQSRITVGRMLCEKCQLFKWWSIPEGVTLAEAVKNADRA